MKKYGYKLRPGYGSKELLLDLDARDSPNQLQVDIIHILKHAGFKLKETKDLWIDGELRFVFCSETGTVSFSSDIWDLFFIQGENNNQADILKLDLLLSENPFFEKIIANYADYE